jgi:hypothetical protein
MANSTQWFQSRVGLLRLFTALIAGLGLALGLGFSVSASGAAKSDSELPRHSDAYLGQGVWEAGDVNGDGYADVIVAARAYATNTGRVYIYAGGPAQDADGLGRLHGSGLSAARDTQ